VHSAHPQRSEEAELGFAQGRGGVWVRPAKQVLRRQQATRPASEACERGSAPF